MLKKWKRFFGQFKQLLKKGDDMMKIARKLLHFFNQKPKIKIIGKEYIEKSLYMSPIVP